MTGSALDYPAFIRQLRKCRLDTIDDRLLIATLLSMAADELESLLERNKVQAHEIAHLQGYAWNSLKRLRKKKGAE